MLESETKKAGMDANPFGGEPRIDKINLLEFLEPNADPDKVLYLRVIQDAVSNYLYTFLGRNGTSPNEFFSSWQYLFKINSTDKKSWDHHRKIKNTYTSQGQKVCENRYLTDNELEMMCFDKHYELSGLPTLMSIDQFRTKLKDRRRKILDKNWDQVVSYIGFLYQKELSQIAGGRQIPLQVWSDNMKLTLVDPISPYHLASLIYVPSKLKTVKKRHLKPSSISAKAKFAQRIQENNIPKLEANWGPLAEANQC